MADLYRREPSELDGYEFKPVGYTEEDVRQLAEVLREAMRVLSDRLSGGKMLTSREEASRTWDQSKASLAPFRALLDGGRANG